MKICAGLGAAQDFKKLADAGADELFMGYVPFAYLEKYSNVMPLNRREVLYSDIQAGSMQQMRELAHMKTDAGVAVALTFNALYYLPQQHEMIGDMLEELYCAGFDSVIMCDPALIMYLRANGYRGRIHLSGEAGVVNVQAMRFFEKMGISRFIFPRKITPEEMGACIKEMPGCEYEAFVLNEMCHFSGAYCNSLHCDDMDHICNVEYKRCGPDFKAPVVRNADDRTGADGCGLCALGRLKSAGITHIKLVGRGVNADRMARDICLLKQALRIERETHAGTALQHRIQKEIFGGSCPRRCYYPMLEN